jgi:hypothetical protein
MPTRRLTRYLTRTCVAVNEATAVRLAKRDLTERVDIAPGLELLHAQDGWAWWSDGRVTTSTGLPDALRLIRSLAPDAAELIGEVYHSIAGGPPACAGGWRTLAAVARIERSELIEEGTSPDGFEPPCLRRLAVRMVDGTARELWLRTAASAEGIAFSISDHRDPAPVAPAHRALNLARRQRRLQRVARIARRHLFDHLRAQHAPGGELIVLFVALDLDFFLVAADVAVVGERHPSQLPRQERLGVGGPPRVEDGFDDRVDFFQVGHHPLPVRTLFQASRSP